MLQPYVVSSRQRVHGTPPFIVFSDIQCAKLHGAVVCKISQPKLKTTSGSTFDIAAGGGSGGEAACH